MKKVVKINNEKQLKSFYRKLPFYKSILFKFTSFELQDDKYNIQTIINALNIKNRRKRITYIHNEICDMIDKKYSGNNMCDFKCDQCMFHRKLEINKLDGCCGNCKYKSRNGCTTKNFACKMFYCSEVKKQYNLIKYKDIKLLGYRQRILLKSAYFSSQKDVITDLYIGSLFIGGIRISYRLLRDMILKVRINKC